MSPNFTHEQLRNSLSLRLGEARAKTDELFSMLDPKAISERPIAERHRIIFYLGHFEAFDWNLLGRTTLGLEPFNESFDTLFAFGIDAVDGGLPSDTASDWPDVSEISSYNQRVRKMVDDFLEAVDFEASEDLQNGLVFQVAVEHRLMHAETLAYMLHWLSLDCKISPATEHEISAPERNVDGKAEIPAGQATLGQAWDQGGFGWDNEFSEVINDVPPFVIDLSNVTNGQFLEFVRSGGYKDRNLWQEDDWAWKSKAGISHPCFWEKNGEGWLLRNMFDIRPLPLSWPVYVSHAEAAAYARWRGASLPTESQLHRAAYGTPAGNERDYPWGSDAPRQDLGNFDLHRWNATPVGSFPSGDSAFGVSDLIGNGWEWSSTVFEPFDGFEHFHFYPGYSANFFDGKHYVMKGASARTSKCMLRRSFRNWFQPHYPHIYSSFRCVEA
jgi:iron(II)-dependent oxidoreductase